MNKTVCKPQQCVGCNACVQVCSKNAIHIEDCKYYLNAVIDPGQCVDCGLCSRVCQQNSTPVCRSPISWQQGWTQEENIRLRASSGGIASAVAKAFLEKEGSVYTCRFSEGSFTYQKVLNTEALAQFVGSKYVKSNTGATYSAIKAELLAGASVLFIGLPCHVQGLKLFVGDTLLEQLYTVDLICHGTPSFGLYQDYQAERGVDLKKADAVSFRHKTLYSNLPSKGFQYWLVPFLRGLTFTENCYACQFAREERVSDLTVGDALGSALSSEERNKGVSLILCNTQKGAALLQSAKLHLEPADREEAKKHNLQLVHSTVAPSQRAAFVEQIGAGGAYCKAIKACYGKDIAKEKIKGILPVNAMKKLLKRGTNQAKIAYSENVIQK